VQHIALTHSFDDELSSTDLHSASTRLPSCHGRRRVHATTARDFARKSGDFATELLNELDAYLSSATPLTRTPPSFPTNRQSSTSLIFIYAMECLIGHRHLGTNWSSCSFHSNVGTQFFVSRISDTPSDRQHPASSHPTQVVRPLGPLHFASHTHHTISS